MSERPIADIPIGVVTISDRASRGVYEDKGGPGIEAALKLNSWPRHGGLSGGSCQTNGRRSKRR